MLLLLFITLANQSATEVGNVGTVMLLQGLQQAPNEPPVAEGSDRPRELVARLFYGQSTRVRDRARALSREFSFQNAAQASSRTRTVQVSSSPNGRGPATSGYTERQLCP